MSDKRVGGTVLVVDDDPTMIRALVRTLKDQHHVLTASDAVEAVSVLEARSDVGVILSDYSMPGMSGVELLRRAATLAPLAIRILMSGMGELATFRDAIDECHLYTFVAKPFQVDALRVVIERAVEQHELVAQNASLVAELEERAARENALRRAFQQYVPKEVVEDLVEAREPASLVGLEREVTILLADLRGFTGFAETRSPAEVVQVLNRYFDAMSRPLLEHGGTIDKYIGDAILAHFGGLRADPRAADHAVNAALGMRAALARLNARHAAEGMPVLHFGVGINTGRCIIGNVGCAARMDFTIIGDAVNVAARVQELTKSSPDAVYITASTRERLTLDVPLPSLPPVSIRGRQHPIALYEVGGRLPGSW